jgi:hypothetical protein
MQVRLQVGDVFARGHQLLYRFRYSELFLWVFQLVEELVRIKFFV